MSVATVGRWIARRAPGFRVASVDLRVAPSVRTAERVFPPGVVDALDFFRQVTTQTELGRTARRLAAATRVTPVPLVEPGSCRDADVRVKFPRIGECSGLSISSNGKPETRQAALIAEVKATVRAPRWEMQGKPAVRTGTAHLRQLPQMRPAVPADCLSMRDCDSYVREVQVQKGLPEGTGELLAVFRSVPVEGVAKFRFFEPKRLLFFTMSPAQRAGICRVHDVAAVRDANGTTHVVAHRTRFRTVVLE